MKKIICLMAFLLCAPAFAHLIYYNVNDGEHLLPDNGMVGSVYTHSGERVPPIECISRDAKTGEIAQVAQWRIYYNANYRIYTGCQSARFFTRTMWLQKPVYKTEIYVYPLNKGQKPATIEFTTLLKK